MKPIAIDLYCGLGGWAEGFLAEGYEVIGYDIEAHDYGTGGYPGTLVLQDVTTLHGSQFKDATVIVGSSPCQKYSYMAMPWKRAKEMGRYYADKSHPERLVELNELFNAQFRIQREASTAAGRYIPLIVENVKGAQKWVGRAAWHYGSFYLWGDLPALMPIAKAMKNDGGSWFNVAHNTESGVGHNPDGRKILASCAERRWEDREIKRLCDATKVPGIKLSEVGFNVAAAQRYREGLKFSRSGDAWFDGKPRDKMLGDKCPAAYGSKSNSRKAASAMIAKIPFPLGRHIAASFKYLIPPIAPIDLPLEELLTEEILESVGDVEHDQN